MTLTNLPPERLPDTILQAIRGTPANVLLALLLSAEPVTGVQALARRTGLNMDTVSRALHILQGQGLVTQTSRYKGWRLAKKEASDG